jgi:hypothetical protein
MVQYLAHESPGRYGGQSSARGGHQVDRMVFLLCMLVNAWCAKLQWKWDRGGVRLDLDRMQASLVSSVLVSLLLYSQTTKVVAMESKKEIALFGGSE